MPMWVRDAETGGFLAVNDAAVRLYGYSREEFASLTGFDIRPQEEHGAYRKFVRERDPRQNTVKRWRHRRKDGGLIDVEIFSHGFTYEGRPVRLALINDITERVRAEQALRESEERYRRLVEMSPSPILLRRGEQVLFANPAALKFFGAGAGSELAGRSYFDLVHSDDHEAVRARLRMIETARKTTETQVRKFRRLDGEIIYGEVSGSPFPYQGEMLIIITIHDVTERRKASEALAAERNLLRSVIDALPDHVYVKDRQRRYLLINASGLEARGARDHEAIAGKTVFDLLPSGAAAASDVEDRNVLDSGLPMVNREQSIVTPDGATRWYLTTKVPLRDAAGTVIGVIGINRDITEIRGAAEAVRQLNAGLEQRVAERTRQLEMANRELESFSYSVSHDLRAPLRSIDGFSQALLEDYAARLDDTGQDYLRRVRAAAQRMATLIEDLLALSRVSRAEMRGDDVDLSALAAEIVEELRRQEPGREVSVKIEPGMTAHGDPNLLRIALQNLLHNSWKFTANDPAPAIEVATIRDDGKCVFFVRDNGAGFDMAYSGKLFGAFQRLHGDAQFPGIGVGLATVQRIVRRHGGEVWAEAAVERGATFYFTLG